MSGGKSEAYRAAGVDIDAGDELVRRIGPIAAATRIPGAIGGIGGFGGVFDLAAAGFGADAPALVAGADGVGTKLRIAFATGRHDTIGIDCVAMCVNDILTTGARPLFFLDYLATGRLDPGVAEDVVRGVAEGCRLAGCWLMGGETAEMPGMYADGEYDLAGFAVGAVTDSTRIDGTLCQDGDVVLAIPSSGLHSNGFSLVRRVLLERAGLSLDEALEPDMDLLGDVLLTPTRIYTKLLDSLRHANVPIHALAHITGGGLWENPQRALPGNLSIRFDTREVRGMRQPIFERISAIGEVSEEEMYRVFNMGIGMTLVVGPDRVAEAQKALRQCGEHAVPVGVLVPRGDDSGVILEGLSTEPVA
ncbi:MAG: phosphoribosylformylglycinamidine cyclo-ligase [Deltaproteobacteria bacterium]|nr:MAG: phosphoribosylformylglycinamidine cyclo-ligase [Deltaproteobacteria bacterium]